MSYLEEYWKEQRIKKFKQSREEYDRRQREKAALYAQRYGATGQMAMDLGFMYEGNSHDSIMAMAHAMLANMTPKYILGIDPITEGGSSLAFPSKQVKELGTKTETKMKTKRFYHDFEYEDRDVTICLLVEEKPQSIVDRMSGRAKQATVKVGYSVCVPTDDFDQELAKRISTGRAESDKARLETLSMDGDAEFLFDLGILNASARIMERKIKRGQVVIKGIRPLKDEE